jgi:hypothetical protein
VTESTSTQTVEAKAEVRGRHISYSELSDFRQCPFKHDLAYRQRWTPPEAPGALATGSLFHKVMEAHYRIEPEKSIDSLAIATLLYAEDGTQNETQELVSWMYAGYLERYGADEEWEVLEVEKKSEVGLPVPGGKRRSPIRLKVKIDNLRRNVETGLFWLWDYKTNSRFPNELGLEMEDQFPLYQWAYEQMGYTIEGVMYDCARTQRNKGPMELDARFKRIPMYYPPERQQYAAEAAWRTAKRISALNRTERERTTSARWCVERCKFTEPCLAGMKGMDENEFMLSLGYTIYDPTAKTRAAEEAAASEDDDLI